MLLQSGADGQTVRLHRRTKHVIQIYPLAKPTMQDGEKDGMKTSHFLHQSHREPDCYVRIVDVNCRMFIIIQCCKLLTTVEA